MAEDAEKRQRAEDFADRMEKGFLDLGASGDFFCSKQRVRWREHSIRAYEGEEASSSEEKTSRASEAASSS